MSNLTLVIPPSPQLIIEPDRNLQSLKELKAQKNREHQKRHIEKVKPYQQLATIQDPIERFVQLIYLTYPEHNNKSKYELMLKVDTFLKSL